MPMPSGVDAFLSGAVATTGLAMTAAFDQMETYLRDVGAGRGAESPTRQAELAQLEQLGRLSLPRTALAIETRLDGLLKSDELEVKPTNWAQFHAKRTVIPAYIAISKDTKIRGLLPVPTIGTDDAGGIMISWLFDKKYALANFGATPQSKSFIYFEQLTPLLKAEVHDVEVLNDLQLSNRLRWLVGQ